MPRLAIIIPWYDSQAAFEDTLVSVLQNRPKRSEVFVIHAHPYHDPYRIRDEDVVFVERQGCSQLQLINAGLQMVNSPVVHVLGCGMEVEAGWAEPALSCFNDPCVSCVAPLVLERANQDRLVAAGVSFSGAGQRRVCGSGRCVRQVDDVARHVVGPLLTAGFYRTEDLLALSGFDEATGDCADVDVGLSLRSLGQQCIVCTESRLVGSPVQQRQGSFDGGRHLERVFWRHAPQPLSRRLKLQHALSILAQLFAQLPSLRGFSEACGRMAAMRERSSYAQFRERLDTIAARGVHAFPSSSADRPRRMAA